MVMKTVKISAPRFVFSLRLYAGSLFNSRLRNDVTIDEAMSTTRHRLSAAIEKLTTPKIVLLNIASKKGSISFVIADLLLPVKERTSDIKNKPIPSFVVYG